MPPMITWEVSSGLGELPVLIWYLSGHFHGHGRLKWAISSENCPFLAIFSVKITHFWSLWSHIWVCCSQHVLGITISLDLDLVNTIYQWKLFITWKLIIFAFLGVKKAPNGPQNENTPSYPQNWSFSYTRTVDFMPLRWSDMGPKRAVWNFLPMTWFTL